ncbi:thioredoxin domain-containing protein 11 [Bombina bombina]|uniref:thioredoxin domain-containing protein 11 n=1 Tax=Bombina bombina TaxID=8345 RepID=UPI00235A9CF0|nr:thioredoxin domain-containing protein 11 [Bombina bombina]
MHRLGRLHIQRLLCLMGRRPELLCGALALSCALIVALRFTCSRAKDVVMPARPPMHFFSSQSPVVDLFRGQIDYAEYIRQDSEITMFFLYAPWCGQSLAARAEIEKVANKLADQVLFVAVNCWWQHGKCRKQKSFFYFPVINLYHKSFGPIEYKGPMTAGYIEKFVRRVMSPLLYIPSLPVLQGFLSHYEPAVLGYFEFNSSPQPPGYLTFFSSALHSLQKDYLATIRFGVITDGKLAKEISLTSPGSVYLHRNLNSSLVYPEEEMNFTAVGICKWALDNRETLLPWLRPHGGKSLLLNNELKKGPALFLFLPFNPLAEHQPLLDEITEMTFSYKNCTQSVFVQHGQEQNFIKAAFSPDTSFSHSQTYKVLSCCNTVVLPQWHFISRVHNVCELCINQSAGVRPIKVSAPQCNFLDIQAALDSFYLKEQFFLGFISTARECNNFLSFYSPFSHYTACCQTVRRGLMTSDFVLTSHREDSEHLIPHIEENILVSPSNPVSTDSINGLRCRTNKTLNLYLLDSNLSWTYAERLGASGAAWHKEFAAIVDVKAETHYVLDQHQPLIRPTLEAFIQNFSKLYSPLQRHLTGDSVPHESQYHLITEVTTSTFNRIVLGSKKDVLLLYYTIWCGFCAALNHIFIRVAQLLATDSLIIARVNIARNDLPWEFMVDRIPTILFFPLDRKDNSVKYPEDQPITLAKLLKFILKHATLPSTDLPPSCPKHYRQYTENHVSYMEQEILRLRAEIEVLHKAQDQLAGYISEVRKDKQDLKVQKQMLAQHNNALEIHKGQLQMLYEQKVKEVGALADKLKELAAASEQLLTENTLLKLIMASLEAKHKNSETEEVNHLQDGIQTSLDTADIEGISDSSTTEGTMTLKQTKDNKTD